MLIHPGYPEKQVLFRDAYDRRNLDPEKNFGVASLRIIFVLKYRQLAISFTILTGWNLPHIKNSEEPIPTELSVHKYDENGEDCCYLGKCECHMAGSVACEEILGSLVRFGDDGVWTQMKKVFAADIEASEKG